MPRCAFSNASTAAAAAASTCSAGASAVLAPVPRPIAKDNSVDSYPGPPFRQEIEACLAVERVRWTNADPGCGMKKFVKLLCAAVLFGMVPTYVTREPQGPARSQDGPCELGQLGRSSYRIKQEGEFWTYLLTASGP